MKISIIGTGVYALAMAHSLSLNKKNKIIMWSESDEAKKKIESNRQSLAILGGLNLDSSIKITTSYEEALIDSQVVFIMCAAKFVSSVTKEIKPFVTKQMHFVI